MKAISHSWVNLESLGLIHTAALDSDTQLSLRIITANSEAQSRVLAHYSLDGIGAEACGATDITVNGSARSLGKSFFTAFARYAPAWYGAEWPAMVPEKLAADIVSILGLDNYGMFRSSGLETFLPSASLGNGFTGSKMAELYKFPAGNGGGINIGVVELDGSFSQNELNYYFSTHNLGTAPVVNVVLLNGTTQVSNDASIEVALDVQIIAAICPAANITIYFSPNSMQGFYEAIRVAGLNNDVVSISWGQDESSSLQTQGYLNSFSNLIGGLGKPVFISSGDYGSAGATGSGLHVSFPASVPTAYACGGTTIVTDATNATIVRETAWTGSGGGYSAYYPIPGWQTSIVPGSYRGVPDFSANADPKTGYSVYTQSTGNIVVGGTSAVAPLMAALFALINANRGTTAKIGSINSEMYTFLGMNVYRDITAGSNGAYSASSGWDPATGLGVINGITLQNLIYPPPVSTEPVSTEPVSTEPVPLPPPAPVEPPPPPVSKEPVPKKPVPPPPPVSKEPVPKKPVLPPPPPVITEPVPVILSVSPSVILQSVVNPQISMSGMNLLVVANVLINGKAARIAQITDKVIVIYTGQLAIGSVQIVLVTKSGKSILVNEKLIVIKKQSTVTSTPKKQADRSVVDRRISANRGNLIK